jgi:hypothetical protein
MPKTKEQIRASLSKGAAQRLRNCCYPAANEQNIMTDKVYRTFFREILSNKLVGVKDSATRLVIMELMDELLIPLPVEAVPK